VFERNEPREIIKGILARGQKTTSLKDYASVERYRRESKPIACRF
jgi:hypothetical protein